MIRDIAIRLVGTGGHKKDTYVQANVLTKLLINRPKNKNNICHETKHIILNE